MRSEQIFLDHIDYCQFLEDFKYDKSCYQRAVEVADSYLEGFCSLMDFYVIREHMQTTRNVTIATYLNFSPETTGVRDCVAGC